MNLFIVVEYFNETTFNLVSAHKTMERAEYCLNQEQAETDLATNSSQFRYEIQEVEVDD